MWLYITWCSHLGGVVMVFVFVLCSSQLVKKIHKCNHVSCPIPLIITLQRNANTIA